jgi:hypothetical protein
MKATSAQTAATRPMMIETRFNMTHKVACVAFERKGRRQALLDLGRAKP